jgi:predicted transcriptional regulator
MRGMTDRTDRATASLGPLERRVMARLWAAGPQTVGEVLGALNDGSDRRLAYTTVMTILVRLHEKGLVTRGKEGRNYRYTAAVDEGSLGAELGRRELNRLIERYGAASVAGFAADLGEGELSDRLRKLGQASRESSR